jgi:hypothetical protein
MIFTLMLTLAVQQGAARRGEFDGPEEYEVVRTKTAITLAQNAWEGDLVVFLFEFDDVDDSDIDLDLMGFRAEAAYGVTDWLTAEIEVPFLRVDPDPGGSESGIGDIQLEGKMSFNRNRKSPAGFIDMDIAGGVRFTLPTGDDDDGTGQEHATAGLFGAVSHRFTPIIAGHGEIFVQWQKDHRPLHGVNVVADFTPWGRDLSLLAGLNIIREGTEDTEVDFVPGVEYRFAQPRLALGAGLPIGLTDDSPNFGVILDLQLAF